MSDLLSVFNWNVRGLNSLVRRETVRDMVQSVKPVVVCLQETKLALFTQQLAIETLGHNLDGYCYLLANGTKSGILVMWQTDHIEATNVTLKDYCLSVEIKFKSTSLGFLLTSVYGHTGEDEGPKKAIRGG
jgi:exonuclease III